MISLDITKIKDKLGSVLKIDVLFEMDPLQSQHGQLFSNSPLKLKGVLTNEDGIVFLTGLIEGEVNISCGRCLELFNMSIAAEINEVYYNETMDSDQVDEDWIPFRGNELDVASEVVKAMISSLPMKVLCNQECKGLCPGCGINLNQDQCSCKGENIDPRLEVLKNFLE